MAQSVIYTVYLPPQPLLQIAIGNSSGHASARLSALAVARDGHTAIGPPIGLPSKSTDTVGRLRDKTTTAIMATSAARPAMHRQARKSKSRGERETHAPRDSLTPREYL